jgi:hypothetical protein
MIPATTLQSHAASMQSLARPVTEVPCALIVRMRLAQLDSVFWDNEWGELAPAVFWRWERCRAELVGQLVVAERIEGVMT